MFKVTGYLMGHREEQVEYSGVDRRLHFDQLPCSLWPQHRTPEAIYQINFNAVVIRYTKLPRKSVSHLITVEVLWYVGEGHSVFYSTANGMRMSCFSTCRIRCCGVHRRFFLVQSMLASPQPYSTTQSSEFVMVYFW